MDVWETVLELMSAAADDEGVRPGMVAVAQTVAPTAHGSACGTWIRRVGFSPPSESSINGMNQNAPLLL